MISNCYKLISLYNNKFLKVLSANGVVSVLKLAMSVVANKVVAMMVGASGVALIGQLYNFVNISMLVSSGGFNQGITKYIAEFKENDKRIATFIKTGLVTTILSSLLCGLLLVVFAHYISVQLLKDEMFYSIFIVFGFSLVLYNMNNYLIAIINGYQNYKLFFKVSLITTLVGVILTIVLVVFLKLYGAFLSIVLSQAIILPITYWYVKKRDVIENIREYKFSKPHLYKLLKYTSITIFGAIMWPIVRIWIRIYVMEQISTDEAGFWEAVSKINDYIVRVAVGAFSVYLIPRFSEIKNKQELFEEFVTVYKILIPILLGGFLFVYLFRDNVILVLYTPEFLKAGDYLLLQMVGSFFWMLKLVPMNLMLSKGSTKLYLLLEISFCLIYVVFVFIFIPKYQVQGIQLAFAMYNFIYCIVSFVLIKKYFI